MKSTDDDKSSDSFNPTPRLKSDRGPIFFIPFNNENICNNCNFEYSETFYFKQKYCKICMKKFTNKPIEYFDIVQINTNNKRKATKNVELTR
ncbi:kinase-like domain-containing protein [Rhizophagus irregularis DAOM 181602=DAOM 197198]|nr:kinase-like domain-containing protein [Rhizophagus irregularis DAOM 181602=DAOM 197198]